MHRREALKAMGAAAAALPYLQSSDSFDDIYRHIEGSFDRHLAALQELIRQKSISSEGVEVEKCAELLAGTIRGLGSEAEAELAPTDGFPVVFGDYDVGAPRTLLVYCLYDVVHVVESEWSVPPFEARLVDVPRAGKAIMARGASNQKGPLRALINAMESIIAVRGQLPLNVMFAIEGEEELGSPHLPQFIERYAERLKRADGCFFPSGSQDLEGNVILYLGNKGIVYVELEASGSRMARGPKEFDLSSYQQGIVESPTWRLVEALETLTDHSGTRLAVESLRSAVIPPSEDDRRMMRQLLTSFDPDRSWKRRLAVSQFADDLSGEALLERYLFHPSFNIDGIWAGYTGPGVATLMPQKATAKLDLRLVPDQKAELVVPELRRHLDARGFEDVTIRKLAGYDWSRTRLDAPMTQALVRTYRSHGHEPQIWPLMAAGNPSYLFTQPPLSLPKLNGGIGHGARQHSVDEYFVVEGEGRIAGLVEAEKFFVDFLYEFARG